MDASDSDARLATVSLSQAEQVLVHGPVHVIHLMAQSAGRCMPAHGTEAAFAWVAEATAQWGAGKACELASAPAAVTLGPASTAAHWAAGERQGQFADALARAHQVRSCLI